MRIGCVAFTASAIATAASGQTLFGPSEYLSQADSPFAGLQGFAVEDFEDGALNLPGLAADRGNPLGPSGLTDSVDGDDGVIDGFGRDGHSFFANPGSPGITFTFNADQIGFVPTSAGVVWTDGSGTIEFEAFDLDGNLIGQLSGNHSMGGSNGGTAEDRFYGITYEGGIGSIFIRNAAGGIEVDHVQYAVPAPGAAVMLLIAAATPRVSRRRR